MNSKDHELLAAIIKLKQNILDHTDQLSMHGLQSISFEALKICALIPKLVDLKKKGTKS